MKIVVIGGTGLIGSKVVERLRKQGHQVVPASRTAGIDVLTGEGLDEAFAGADVVVDVANSPSFEDQAVLAFFETPARNVAAAERKADVKHHVALSVVGTGTRAFAASGYIKAKVAQEKRIRSAGIPYTIVQATQFFEFLGGIAGNGGEGDDLVLSSGMMQPIASDDVSDAIVDHALGSPLNGTVEIAGPEKAPLAEWVRRFLVATGDRRKVISDPAAPYFGAVLEPDTLLPGPGARCGHQDFQQWFARSAFAKSGATK